MMQCFKNSIFKILGIVAIIFSIPSCKPDNLKEGAVKEYFDIKGYFKKKEKEDAKKAEEKADEAKKKEAK